MCWTFLLEQRLTKPLPVSCHVCGHGDQTRTFGFWTFFISEQGESGFPSVEFAVFLLTFWPGSHLKPFQPNFLCLCVSGWSVPRWAIAVLVCWFILKVNDICRIKYSLLTWAWYSSPASCGVTPMKVGQLEGGVPGVEHAEGVYGNICLSVHHQKQHWVMVYSRHVKLLSPCSCVTTFMLTRRHDQFKGQRSILRDNDQFRGQRSV